MFPGKTAFSKNAPVRLRIFSKVLFPGGKYPGKFRSVMAGYGQLWSVFVQLYAVCLDDESDIVVRVFKGTAESLV